MKKAVIFDVGGVLVRLQSQKQRHKWDKRLGLPKNTLEELYYNSAIGEAAQIGLVSDRDNWMYIGGRFNLSLEELHEVETDFWIEEQLDEPLIDYIRQLKENPKVKTAIISNWSSGLNKFLDQWGIREFFDVVTISAEVHTMKPAPEIFTYTCSLLDVDCSSAIFIDDFTHNIEGAEAVGLTGIHYPKTKTATDLIAEIKALL